MIIQEEFSNKSIALSFQCAKATSQALAKAMLDALRKMKQIRDAPKQGKQSVKQLAKGGTISNVEITEKNIKAFDPVARKYRISYALQKDSSCDPPNWMVYFRAKDSECIKAAFKEFSNITLKRDKDKPSTRATMRKEREKIKHTVRDRTKHKKREGLEL
jgi:hypothetical protein